MVATARRRLPRLNRDYGIGGPARTGKSNALVTWVGYFGKSRRQQTQRIKRRDDLAPDDQLLQVIAILQLLVI